MVKIVQLKCQFISNLLLPFHLQAFGAKTRSVCIGIQARYPAISYSCSSRIPLPIEPYCGSNGHVPRMALMLFLYALRPNDMTKGLKFYGYP